MLITGQHEKMLTGLRNNKGSRQLICCLNGESGQWCESIIFLKLLFPFCTSVHSGKVQYRAMSLLHCPPSCRVNLNL